MSLHNPTDEPARLVVLGGPPFTEQIVMWWNFVGRTHDEIVQFREQWQAEDDRFGRVEGYTGETAGIPAPEMPNAVLAPRSNPPA